MYIVLFCYITTGVYEPTYVHAYKNDASDVNVGWW